MRLARKVKYPLALIARSQLALSDLIALVEEIAPPDFGVVLQARSELRPGIVPQSYHRRVALPLFVELVQRRSGCGSIDRYADRFHITLGSSQYLRESEPKSVPRPMNDVRPHNRLRPHVAHHLWQSLQSVADNEMCVHDAAAMQVGEHAHLQFHA